MSSVWPTRRLGELCDVQIGKTPTRSENRYWGDDHAWLSIADMNQGRRLTTTRERISNEAVRDLNLRPVEPGTLLLSFKLSIGKVGVACARMFTNEAIAHLPIVDDSIERDYLYWALRTVPLTADVDRAAMGVTLNKSKLKQIPIPVPPTKEQRRIAAVLDAADALRAKRRQVLAELDTLTQAIFIDMFGDVARSAPLAELLEDAELFVDGDWVETKDQDPAGSVRLTQLADVGVGGWLDRSRRFMTPEAAERLKCTYLQRGDVLIARMPDPIGRACVFPGDERLCVTAVDVCVVRPGRTVDARWLVGALNSTQVRRQIERLATGTTRSRISRRNLGRVALPFVNLEGQRNFARRAAEVEDTIVRCREHSLHLETLLASLQQRAFAGEL